MRHCKQRGFFEKKNASFNSFFDGVDQSCRHYTLKFLKNPFFIFSILFSIGILLTFHRIFRLFSTSSWISFNECTNGRNKSIPVDFPISTYRWSMTVLDSRVIAGNESKTNNFDLSWLQKFKISFYTKTLWTTVTEICQYLLLATLYLRGSKNVCYARIRSLAVY